MTATSNLLDGCRTKKRFSGLDFAKDDVTIFFMIFYLSYNIITFKDMFDVIFFPIGIFQKSLLINVLYSSEFDFNIESSTSFVISGHIFLKVADF